jgi:hypothetical protein
LLHFSDVVLYPVVSFLYRPFAAAIPVRLLFNCEELSGGLNARKYWKLVKMDLIGSIFQNWPSQIF